ncbi:MAG: AAA family ATPase [Ignavibacteria bacterium]
MNKIYAVVGMCGSGKSEVVKYFVSHGYQRVYFGDVVLNELKKNSLEINEKNEKYIREKLRTDFGMAVMALKSLDKIRYLHSLGNVVIESLYSWEEFKTIKEEFGDIFKLIAVYTTKKLRYQRLANRPFRPLNKGEAVARDYAEIENLNKGGPIAFADYTVINDGTLEELFDKLSLLL